jgi:hypothetical protein
MGAGKTHNSSMHFLIRWNEADPDIPILKEGKAEYAKLK